MLLPAPGVLDEPIYLVATDGLSAVGCEEDAHISGEWVPLADAVRMMLTGEIRNMKAGDAREIKRAVRLTVARKV